MDVKVDDGDALESIFGDSVHDACGDIVQKAETAGFIAVCVVSGGADGAKGVPCFLIHYHVHRLNDSTCGVTGSFERTMTHDGVAVETVDFVRLG